MDKNDELFEDILIRQIQTLRLDSSFRKDILKKLKELENKIIKKLNESEIESTIQKNKLNSLLKSVNDLIDETYSQINVSLEEDINSLVVLESSRTEKTLNNILQVNVNELPLKQLELIYSEVLIEGSPTKTWWDRQSEKTKQLFEDNMREGLLRGETNQQLVRRVRGTRSFGFTNGIMNSTRKEAESLVRSSVQAAANEARIRVFDENLDIIKSYRHVSTLDSRTSDVCVVRDGLRWDAKSKKGIKHNLPFRVPPIHWNCRSTLIPELKGIDLPDDAERASVDGPVKAKVTFNEFLKGKSEVFQDDLLGKSKAQLWRDGKITLRQLLDTSGNPLTLSELKIKYDI